MSIVSETSRKRLDSSSSTNSEQHKHGINRRRELEQHPYSSV